MAITFCVFTGKGKMWVLTWLDIKYITALKYDAKKGDKGPTLACSAASNCENHKRDSSHLSFAAVDNNLTK